MWPRNIQNDAFENDVIEVLSVSSETGVVPCLPSPDSPAPVDLLTDRGYMCLLCGPWVHVCSVWSAAVCFSI